jgi:ComF family protein
VLLRLSKLKGAALDLLFPQWCIACGVEGASLCQSCRDSLPRIVNPICPRCGKPQISGILCPNCVNWKAAIDGIRAPLRFEGVARKAIHQFKYKNLRNLAKPLSLLMRDYLAKNPLQADTLVPVPLHPKRLKERGFNQSALLANALGELLGTQVDLGCLVRSRFYIPQAQTSSVDERRTNVADAFLCRDGALSGKKILLIDDVCTSGATLNACATALRAGGALTVWGMALAREL